MYFGVFRFPLDSEDSGVERLVSMTGNGSKVAIPSAFLLYKHATSLVAALVEGTEVTVGFDNGKHPII